MINCSSMQTINLVAGASGTAPKRALLWTGPPVLGFLVGGPLGTLGGLLISFHFSHSSTKKRKNVEEVEAELRRCLAERGYVQEDDG
jgi:hypothetical protein